MQQVKGKIRFTIYGPVHVEEYWKECQEELKKLPPNVTWDYKENVESEKVVETLKPYHVFLFPTLGENYGHVIQEALSAGCACILSDQTPWKELEENGVGYVFPVDNSKRFADTLDIYEQLDEKQFNCISNRALDYAVLKSNLKLKNTGYRRVFAIDRE